MLGFGFRKSCKKRFDNCNNAINHYDTIKPMIDKAFGDERFDCLIVPICTGELVCRRK